jgi:hypothetical protein
MSSLQSNRMKFKPIADITCILPAMLILTLAIC